MCSGYGGSGRCNVVVGDSYGVTFWPEYSCDEFIYPCILKIYISVVHIFRKKDVYHYSYTKWFQCDLPL